MRVLFRKPMNQPLELIELEDDESVKKMIGGYMQVITIRPDIFCVCDEDGLTKDLEPNYWNDIYGQIYGNVIFCSMNKNGFDSLNIEQINFVKDYIGFPLK